MKAAGMNLLWAILPSVAVAVLVVSISPSGAAQSTRKPAGSTLRIVQDMLIATGGLSGSNYYQVKGAIYNPNNEAVKNVVIRYFIWKKWLGQDGHGSIIKDTGGLVTATIKYLPPKQTVDFIATSPLGVPRMTTDSGLLPDPISAEITAEWDDQP